jgi:tetratricopeptide (TPR) repeat protein
MAKKPTWGFYALSRVTEEEAAQFEEDLKSDPNNERARAGLLSYYSVGKHPQASELRRQEHVLWVLEHVPTCGLGRTPFLRISRKKYPEAYARARQIILAQCEKYADDPEVVGDLGCIFSDDEPELAHDILRKAIANAPEKSDLGFWLAPLIFKLAKAANDRPRIHEAIELLRRYVDDKPHFRFFLAKMALNADEYELAMIEARKLMDESLAKPDSQAEHVAQTIFGTIAFHNGEVSTAINHLHAAGRVDTAPRLASYGPHMNLAQLLLDHGERDAVLKYLEDCKKFWNLGQRDLEKWISAIKAGKTPKLKGDDD